MKIIISSLELNTHGEIPKNFSVESRRRCQTEYAVDSRLARVFDRGNAVCSVSFEIERSHSSQENAETFAILHASEIHSLSSATLKIETGGEHGRTFSLSEASPTRVKVSCDGLITTARYEFSGAATLQV